jgi:hypothetical protein
MNKSTIAYVSSVLLFFGILNLPMGYYDLLRVVISVSAGYFALELYGKSRWAFAFIGIAILFNPIFPMYLTKSSWQIIDIVCGSLFLISIKDVAEV